MATAPKVSASKTAKPIAPMTTTRAPMASRPNRPVKKKPETFEEMVQAELGWDPRITVYVTDDKTMRRYQKGKGKWFTQTSPEYEIGGYRFQQVGAWRENENVGDKRIVRVEIAEA